MSVKKHIPNFITLLNLASGLIALVFAFNEHFFYAFLWVCIGVFFDFWDGFFARILKVKSAIGLQLDSLADMVTSGVVPGLVMYQLLTHISENYVENFEMSVSMQYFYIWVLPYTGFIITLASCYRLAKFNVDSRQTDSFIELPTPANALFIMSLPLISADSEGMLFSLLSNPYVLIGITLLSAFMLNAEIPLFSLKVKYFNWEKNKIQFIFLIISILLLFIFQFVAIPLIILLYVMLSVINNKITPRQQ